MEYLGKYFIILSLITSIRSDEMRNLKEVSVSEVHVASPPCFEFMNRNPNGFETSRAIFRYVYVNIPGPDRIRCEACRTINLAKHVNHPKPDMQIYDKCRPTQKICPQVAEVPIHPTCIKVCSKEEYKLRKSGKKLSLPAPSLHYAHGKLMYMVKAGILVSAVYFTYTQGVWGDQQDVTECIRRWQEYIRSINTRRPPAFDQSGNVIRKESSDSFFAPVYLFYKSFITTCFQGIVKVPLIVKCAYVDYIKALKKRQAELDKERETRKRSVSK